MFWHPAVSPENELRGPLSSCNVHFHLSSNLWPSFLDFPLPHPSNSRGVWQHSKFGYYHNIKNYMVSIVLGEQL